MHRYDGHSVSKSIEPREGIDTILVDGNDGGMTPRYMVVGFEVVPCSHQHNIEASSNIKMYGKYPISIGCSPFG